MSDGIMLRNRQAIGGDLNGLVGTAAHDLGQRGHGSRIWRTLLRLLGIAPFDRSVDQPTAPSSLAWPQAIAVNAGVASLLAAASANASRIGQDWATIGFYISIAIIFLPVGFRLALPDVCRSERIANLLIAALGLFALRVIRAPLFFVGHDEYLHWTTAQNIIETGHLFSSNVLFPIGPAYPGLEVVVTAIAELSGASVFVSALVLLSIARLLFVGALYLIYERIAGSARRASLACLFYMGCSTFVFFDTNFSYESLAMPLFALALLINLRVRDWRGTGLPRLLTTFALAVLSLSMTHHVTAYALAALLIGLFLLETISGGAAAARVGLAVAAVLAIAIPTGWSHFVGNPGEAYLGPVFENALYDVVRLVHFSTGRKLFTGDDGAVAPLWQRSMTLASVGLICLGLVLGFFRSLSFAGAPFARGIAPKTWSSVFGWTNSPVILLTMLTFGYPISIVLRLTRGGWEIGNRIGPFAFLGVGIVLSIAATTCLKGESKSVWRAACISAIATIILVGGVISSEGPRILVPARYQVSADAASIEPMGVAAALWTKQWLGAENHFAADRVNRLLLSTYGRQLVSTTLQHGYDAGEVMVAEKFGPKEVAVLQKVGIDYLFTDLRLTTGLPVVGAYFDGATADQMLFAPPKPESLLKFNTMDGVNRVFDNGYAVIFDVRALSGRK
jgi:hypothetical protein